MYTHQYTQETGRLYRRGEVAYAIPMIVSLDVVTVCLCCRVEYDGV